MKWEKVRLADCCESMADGDHLPPPKAESGIPFVTISNIVNNKFDFTNTMFVPEEYYNNLDSKRKAKQGDILYSVVGSFGIPVFIDDDIPFVFQRHIAILRPNSKILPKYLYYTMLSRDFFNMADVAAIGAAQRTITLSSLRNMTISVPTLSIQKRITDILSAYDDLIENNQKQIKLLEEAAQRLYKEWFVDLRFPGHEHTPIVDGVPEGWTYSEIDSVFSIRYGKTLPTSKISSTGKYPVYGANGIIGYYDEKNCDDYSVLITSRGNGSGDVLRTYDKESFITNNSFIVKALNENIGFSYTHQLMVHTDFKNIRTGSAQPQLTNNSISTLKIFIPSNTLIDHYCLSTDAIYKKIIVLLKQIRLATQARDRLLPKLMSGEMEV